MRLTLLIFVVTMIFTGLVGTAMYSLKNGGTHPSQSDLQNARTAESAQDLLDKWGPEDEVSLSRQIYLDFALIPNYVAALATIALTMTGWCSLCFRRWPRAAMTAADSGLVLALLSIAAGLLDAAENGFMLAVLDGKTGWQPYVYWCATVKLWLLEGVLSAAIAAALVAAGWRLFAPDVDETSSNDPLGAPR